MAALGPRYGVQILWPVLLLQQRLLRASLAYIDHGRRHQAIISTLTRKASQASSTKS